MAKAKAFYFIFFGAMACLVPFITLYYQDLGLTGREIGVLTAINPLVGMIGGSLWGMVADATGRHRLTLLAAIVGTWISVFLMTRVGSFVALVPIVTVYAVFVSAIVPLVDDAVIAWLGQENSGEYGRQRVWGSYGWGLAGALIGVVIAASGLLWAFFACLALYVPLFFVASRLPMRTTAEKGTRFARDLRYLLSNRSWLLFLVVSMVVGVSMGVFLNYLFLYLGELGTNARIMGLTLTVSTLSEIPIFFFANRLLQRWSAPFLLAMALLFTILRALGYANIGAPWQVLLVSMLHGPSFAIMWIAGVAYSAKTAPLALGATAQAVFGGVSMGLGPALGALAGGFLFDAYGPLSLFNFVAASAGVALLLFSWINRSAFILQLQPQSGH